MLDPYAAVAARVQLPAGVNVPPPKKGLPSSDSQSNPPALMGCLSSLTAASSFDWSPSSRPKTPLAETLVVELDVASLQNEAGSSHQGQICHHVQSLDCPRIGVYTEQGIEAWFIQLWTSLMKPLHLENHLSVVEAAYLFHRYSMAVEIQLNTDLPLYYRMVYTNLIILASFDARVRLLASCCRSLNPIGPI